MPQSGVLFLLPRVSARSVLVKIACRNKLTTQKGNPADLLNVLIWSHSFPVIMHPCGEEDGKKLLMFEKRGRKPCILFDF